MVLYIMTEIVSNQYYLILLTGLRLGICFPVISIPTEILNLVFFVVNMSLKENLIIKVVLQITGMYSPLCTLMLVVCLKVSINLN